MNNAYVMNSKQALGSRNNFPGTDIRISGIQDWNKLTATGIFVDYSV